MLVLNAEQTRAFAPMPQLIEQLRHAFRNPCVAPPRQVLKAPGGAGERLFLTMPAFDVDGAGAVKLISFFPDNPAAGRPTIQGAVVVFSSGGAPIAVLDGPTVTQLRTGAASALASRYLSREDSGHLVVIGTGALAPWMAVAHCAVRPIRRVTICGRSSERAVVVAANLRSLLAAEVAVAESIESAVRSADIVSCCTNSPTPVLQGKWLKSGTFVDLVGSFSPAKRESDDDVVRRSRIFVDTFEGAFSEAGDLIDPLSRSVIARNRIEGELSDLVCGRGSARRDAEEIIVFKSVGTALEDLATAQFVVSRALESRAGSNSGTETERHS